MKQPNLSRFGSEKIVRLEKELGGYSPNKAELDYIQESNEIFVKITQKLDSYDVMNEKINTLISKIIDNRVTRTKDLDEKV